MIKDMIYLISESWGEIKPKKIQKSWKNIAVCGVETNVEENDDQPLTN